MEEMYKCTQGTCERVFRTLQNADCHFCWNIVPRRQRSRPKNKIRRSKPSVSREKSIHLTISSLEIDNVNYNTLVHYPIENK